MVVLAASIISKSGKALVSRQFVDMSRIRIEGLLAAFPKLVGSGKQHTYVETENVRYVYQPMEALYLLLVTNKQSNILEDLETLRLLSKLVPEFCPALDEESVCKTAFELVFAFDEVISLGHKENITMAQVKQYTEMDSHEERLHNLIIQSKIIATKDEMKRKASEIDKTKIDKRIGGGKGGFMSNSSGNGGRFDNGYSDLNASGGGGFGNNSGFGSLDHDFGAKSRATKPTTTAPVAKIGMQLGKSQKANQFLELLKQEGEVIVDEVQVTAPGARAAPVITDPISISIEEALSVTLRQDGGLESLEVKGEMALVVQKTEDAYIRVQVEQGPNKKNFDFKTHPNIDKDLWSREHTLGMKDPSKPFPTGSQSGILKWRMVSKQESLVPLMINCWPSVSGGESTVNIEYEASKMFDLQNVVIQIPLPALREGPTVNQADGEWRYDSRKSVLEWFIVLIDNTNRSGAMEFVLPPADPSSFFPIDVKFTASKTFCDIAVASVNQTQGGGNARFGGRKQLTVGTYHVV
ncbi:hypothetical protein R1flu_006943 [Riccia fluitans]|uniref:Coatomer subunit delta n=1 Tax=Riccia fluitans TaxID=41844 RepID=A0ABD1YXG3_9MARC